MSKDISEYSSDELYKLAEKKRSEEFLALRPKVIDFKDVTEEDIEKLVELAEIFISDEENVLEVETQYAYEAIMEFVYGVKVWDYINGLGK